ncbi:porphobilinogen synthase [Paenibacillus radicis (ex Gao et al. 2016)]|uniref:Delta-aminolevulinic acid dehydratase n=1 Tax=Paenibacillus radicis (ex Gao et al. 2016) TaxID=1737354 RepID=A0A917M2X5_9BACL|nr:porphobilinogen synthase [Paenibacillus radicis (ex Gao et al. 2016)]GGG74385.1 delta-aminolevulinic acid dehydratase [Paenibacillus radicis (ex Gao et al. 2016)]
MAFPIVRHRRLRQSAAMRNLMRETVLTANDFIYPIFVTYGTNIREEIGSMPGVYHLSMDLLEAEIRDIVSLGIQAIMLFGVPDHKDAEGSSAYDPNGIVQEATRAIKGWAPELIVMADTCLCQFTDHGHCGVVHVHEATGTAVVDNDLSLALLVRTAVSQAEAGADVIAPSNMMDGFVAAIRDGLDEAGFTHIPILSYSVKYASSFYGPFREAAHSTPQFGDRKTYQMDPANSREALREAESDVVEGADMLMVKPALAYLDVVRQLKESFDLPVVAYNVSGEYSMVKAASANGWIDEKNVVLETLTGMKRAGADMIITYHAKDASRWLRGEE